MTAMRVRLTPPVEWKSVDRPFAPQTPEVVLEVTEDDLFSHLIDRALDVLDPDATVVPFYPVYEEGVPALRATLVRLAPAADPDRMSEAGYVHEDPWYAVHDDGTVYRVEAHYPRPVPLRDLLTAAEAGYSDRDFLDVLVSEHHGGYGGGGETVAEWLAFLNGVGIGVTTNLMSDSVKFGLKHLLLRFRGLRLRQVSPIAVEAAAVWDANGFSYPPELRDLFDRKQTWTDSEVARRLKVSVSTARQLLFALGHDPEGATGQWTRGHSRAARRRREHWIKEEFRRSMGRRWRKSYRQSLRWRE